MFILITAFYLGILFFDLFNKLISRTINFPVSASFHNLSYAYYLIFYYLVLYIIHFLDRCHSYTLYGLLLQLSRSYISYNHACKQAVVSPSVPTTPEIAIAAHITAVFTFLFFSAISFPASPGITPQATADKVISGLTP